MKLLSSNKRFALGVLTVFAVVLGLLIGALGWTLFVVAVVALVTLLLEVNRFADWASRPLSRPQNQDTEWHRATHGIYLQLQRERERTRGVLQRLRSLQLITEALPDGVIVANQHGEIEELNGAAKRLLQLSDADRSSNLGTLLRSPDLVALLKDQYQENIIELPSPVDATTQLELRKFRTPDERVVLLVRDVSELNRLLTMRQEFVANVSHELRSPLTVIMGYLESIENDPLDGDLVQELIGRLRSPATRMQALVDDLLLLSRLESSPLPPVKTLDSVDVGDLLTQLSSELQSLITNTHDLQIKVSSSARIIGISNEVFSAFSNLATNAVRYSPDGGCIKLTWVDAPDGAKFSVSDEGTGIAPEHLTRLTERFYRVDLSGARVRGGTGLGLAIVKHVLKRHGSELKITSEIGSGSEFVCLFPESQLRRTSSLHEVRH